MTFSHCHLKFAHHTVFENFHFSFAENQWTCLLGQSGIGKSSLLKIIAGLIKPDSIQNQTELSISYLPQQDCLMPWLSIWENMAIGYQLRGEKKFFPEKKAYELLEKTGLSAAIHLKPEALSGGMRQRAALVRTLLENKPVILMDEPFSSLDMASRLELHTLTQELLQDKTVLLVTHDPLDAVRLADRVHFMEGTPAKLTDEWIIDLPKPRDLQSQEMIQLYMDLLSLLTQKNGSIL